MEINQKGWDKYLTRKASEFLTKQQIIKLHPVAGDGAQAPGSVVLRKWGEQWATHFYNDQDGGFHHGHYFSNLPDAETDFNRRVSNYAPLTAAN